MPKVKRQAHLGKTCVFESSVRPKAAYMGCTTYEGIVTIDDDISIRYLQCCYDKYIHETCQDQ